MQRLLKSSQQLSAPLQLFAELGFPHAVVFGGAPRDILCGVPFRDLDIRIHCTAETFFEKITAFLDHFTILGANIEEAHRAEKLRYLIRAPNSPELDISFRFTSTTPIAAFPIAEERVKNAPVGLSQVAFYISNTGEETFIYSTAFLNDRAAKMITLFSPEPHNLTYAEKIAKKYGYGYDYTIKRT